MDNNNEKKLNGTVIVTYRCNARCSMCNRYKAPSKIHKRKRVCADSRRIAAEKANRRQYSSFRCCWKQMVWQQEKTISLKDGMMPRKMQLSFRLKKMNKVPSRLKSVQLDITSTWTYNTSKWT